MKSRTSFWFAAVATMVIFNCAAAEAALIPITSVAGFPNGRTFNDPPANAVDQDIETFTWTTQPNNTATPSHLAIGFAASSVSRLRLWKASYGGGGENIKNLTIQYTIDEGDLAARNWTTVSSLTNGFMGSELFHATAVNSDGTVTGDVHDSEGGDGWGSLTFDPVNATGLRISFANPTVPESAGCSGLGPPENACNHYRVGEFEAYGQSACGNGSIDAGEQCDDGTANGTINSCCSATCQANQLGTLCDDQNAATSGDACSASGECAGVDPCAEVICVALDDCHSAGECDHETGECSNPPLPDGSVCDDGDACTEEDACSAGACGGTAKSCDDHNVCNGIEICDSLLGCQTADNAPAGTSCDDALFCNGTASCDDSGNCVSNNDAPCPDTQCNHCQEATASCFDPVTVSCNDHDAGSLNDACDGAGTCSGHPVTGAYAILRWPQLPAPAVLARIGWQNQISGRVCTDTLLQRPYASVDGDVVGLASAGTALTFRRTISDVTGDLVTHGGAINGLTRVRHPNAPIIDATGAAQQLVECDSASARAQARYEEWSMLAPESNLGAVNVPRGATMSIPNSGSFGGGQHVVHADEIRIGRGATLQIAGSDSGAEVIIVVSGVLKLSYAAKVKLQGLMPEQVIFVVDGVTTLRQYTRLPASLLASSHINLGWRSVVDGQVLGDHDIRLRPYVTINGGSFLGW